jgi:RNA polymerase sigma-70 factor (ECF subfamily)
MIQDLNNIQDEELWIRIREGNHEALEELYKRVFKMLYQYGLKISHNTTLVEDSIHDLFLDLWRYRENLFATTSVRFYLFSSLKRRIVRNNKTDERALLFDIQHKQSILENSLNQEEIIIEYERYDEQINRLRKHLQNLPPRQYEALLLKFYNEFSYQEIASILEVNEQSARNLVQRGLDLLRKYNQIVISVIISLHLDIDIFF